MPSIYGGRRCGGPAISGESGRRSDARTFQAAPQSIEIQSTVQGAERRNTKYSTRRSAQELLEQKYITVQAPKSESKLLQRLGCEGYQGPGRKR